MTLESTLRRFAGENRSARVSSTQRLARLVESVMDGEPDAITASAEELETWSREIGAANEPATDAQRDHSG